MPSSRLVIISGPPAAGKSTLAPLLARALCMPQFSTDHVKERLADAIGQRALAFADELGEAAQRQTVATARELLLAGVDVMIEGYIPHGIGEPLLAPLVRMAGSVLLHMRADDLTLKHRYENRAVQPDRHWIHGDIARLGTLLSVLPADMAAPLDLGIPRIFIDTTIGPIPVNTVASMVMAAFGNALPRDYSITSQPIE